MYHTCGGHTAETTRRGDHFLSESKSFASSATASAVSTLPPSIAAEALTVQQQALRVEHHAVVGRGEEGRDVPGRLQPAELQEALVLAHGLADELGAARLTLRSDDDRLQGRGENVYDTPPGGKPWPRTCFS